MSTEMKDALGRGGKMQDVLKRWKQKVVQGNMLVAGIAE